MKIAVLSDIHDNIWNLEKALNQIKRPPAHRAYGSERKIEAMVYCGDFCAPFIPPKLATLDIPIYACLGNNDEDQIGLLKQGGNNFNWTFLAEEFGQVDLNGKKIAFCHYPRLGELLAKSGEFDAVFHGHTHKAINETYGKTLLVNPGAVCGIQGGKPGVASYAIYDTKTNSADIIQIK